MPSKTTPLALARTSADGTELIEFWWGGSVFQMTRENFMKVFSGEDITVESGGTISVESGGGIAVKSGGEINFQSGGRLEIAGTQVTANANEINKLDGLSNLAYLTVTEGVSFTEAGDNTYTGTIEIPAGAFLNDVQLVNVVLWDDSGTVTAIVGDDDDPDGWFTGVNMKATDLLVGEVLSARDQDKWGTKGGVYLTNQGRMGRVTAGVDSGPYYGAASEIIGVIACQNGDGSAGRSFMAVTYSVPTFVAATGT